MNCRVVNKYSFLNPITKRDPWHVEKWRAQLKYILPQIPWKDGTEMQKINYKFRRIRPLDFTVEFLLKICTWIFLENLYWHILHICILQYRGHRILCVDYLTSLFCGLSNSICGLSLVGHAFCIVDYLTYISLLILLLALWIIWLLLWIIWFVLSITWFVLWIT